MDELFDSIDADRNGAISYAELRHLLRPGARMRLDYKLRVATSLRPASPHVSDLFNARPSTQLAILACA
jgi:Ca2+-binding EF-hand superfamily protein